MGIFKIAKRFVGYGILAVALASPFVYNLGYQKGNVEAVVMQESGLERVTRNQYLIENPRTGDSYLWDLKEGTINPYEHEETQQEIDRKLDDIFGN